MLWVISQYTTSIVMYINLLKTDRVKKMQIFIFMYIFPGSTKEY